MNSVMHYYCHLLRRHFLSWRMLAVLVVTILTMDAFLMPLREYCHVMQLRMSPWGFALLWNNKYIVLCFLLIFIFASAIFPEDRAKNRYIIARIGVSKWTVAQALYLITFSWIYTFIVYLCLNVLLLNIIDFIPDWGMGWGTLTNGDVIREFGIFTTVSHRVISNYNPLYANILTVCIMGLLLGVLSMLMYWLNFYSKVAGPIITSAVLFMDMAVKKDVRLLKYSPVSWLRPDMHYGSLNTEYPTVTYILTMMILLTLLFLVLAKITANQRQENGRLKK